VSADADNAQRAAEIASAITSQYPTATELMAAAVALNGSAPFPTDPQARRRLMAHAMNIWQEARAHLDVLKSAAQRQAAEVVRLADRGLVPQADSAAEAVVETIMAKGAMSFASFINRIAGSQRTDDNAARVSKWLAWLDGYPQTDASLDDATKTERLNKTEEAMKKLRQEAASPLAPTLADMHAKSFAEWAKENRSAAGRENAKKRRR
jgi:hypothetical protein